MKTQRTYWLREGLYDARTGKIQYNDPNVFVKKAKKTKKGKPAQQSKRVG
jgi:hypothetical protein